MSSNVEQFIGVAISTTSGFYPDNGFDQTPIHQKIKVQIQKATKSLKIVDDTSDWVAIYDGRELNLDESYLDNNLSGEVEIDWGKSEGGGGNAQSGILTSV